MTALEDKTASKKKDLCVDVFKAFIIFVDLTRISTKLFSSKFQVINPSRLCFIPSTALLRYLCIYGDISSNKVKNDLERPASLVFHFFQIIRWCHGSPSLLSL